MSNIIAYVLNNLFLVVGGGLLAAFLAYRVWQRVDHTARSINNWGALIFWAVKTVSIIAILFYAGRLIYTTVNSAVASAIGSPSTQTAAQALVDLGAGVDQLASFDMGSYDFSGNLANIQIPGYSNLISDQDEATAAFSGPNGEETVDIPDTLELKPIEQMFQAAEVVKQTAAVNASIDAPAEAPVGEYVVQPGDSIGKIAKRLGIDADALCAANGLSNCSLINVGQKLVMPGAVAKALNETVAIETSNKLAAPRVTSSQAVYTAPKLNQSYIPKSWNVLEQGEMSVGSPANMSTNTGEVLASFPTK